MKKGRRFDSLVQAFALGLCPKERESISVSLGGTWPQGQ